MAREPADVVPVLAEVERATAAGAWAFGYLAYEAARRARPRRSPSRRGSPGETLPLAVFGLADGGGTRSPADRSPARPATRDYAAGPWRRDWTPAGHRDAVAAVRASIAAGDAYQVNLTVRMHAPVTGDLEQFYADLAYAQRGSWAAYLDIGSHVVASASPELFFDWTGDRAAHPPDEGHRAPGRHHRRGRRGAPGAPGQRQGARREPDDRRPAAQRPGPHRRGGQRRGPRAVPRRALRDGLAAHLRRHRAAAAGRRAGRRLPRPVPLGLGDRRAQAPHHAADPGAGGRPPRRLLRRHRGGRAPRGGLPRAVQRGDPDGDGRAGHRHGGLRHRRGHHLGLRRRRRARRAAGEGRDPRPAVRGVRAAGDDGPPPRWCPAQPRGPPGAAGRLRRVGRLRARPRRRPAAAGPAHRRPRAGPRAAGAAARRRAGDRGRSAAGRRRRSGPAGRGPRAGRRRRRLAPAQDHPAGRLHRARRAVARGRRRRPDLLARGGHRDDDRQPRRPARRPLVDAAGLVRVPARCGARPAGRGGRAARAAAHARGPGRRRGARRRQLAARLAPRRPAPDARGGIRRRRWSGGPRRSRGPPRARSRPGRAPAARRSGPPGACPRPSRGGRPGRPPAR